MYAPGALLTASGGQSTEHPLNSTADLSAFHRIKYFLRNSSFFVKKVAVGA